MTIGDSKEDLREICAVVTIGKTAFLVGDFVVNKLDNRYGRISKIKFDDSKLLFKIRPINDKSKTAKKGRWSRATLWRIASPLDRLANCL